MSDDLVKRWDDHVESLCSPMSTIEHMAQKMRNRIEALTAERDRLREALRDGRRLWAIAQDDRVRLLIQLKQREKRHE